MPEAAVAVPKGGKNNGGTYVDRDKPAQIRFSNISAGKGKFLFNYFIDFICGLVPSVQVIIILWYNKGTLRDAERKFVT